MTTPYYVAVYDDYASYAATCPLDSFKSNPRYTHMLEHVGVKDGILYTNILKTECGMKNSDIVEFCNLNDRIGSPTKHVIPELSSRVSPTSLRYLYHGWLILNHMEPGSSIVEIGCGYGGLCIALDFLSKKSNKPIASYECVDLDEAISLEKRYIENFSLSFPVTFHSSSTYGSTIDGDNKFLISNYCFSEISNAHQTNYIRTLFPKVSRGFIVWNHIPLYDFGKKLLRVEAERPLTGNGNMFIFF